MRRLFLSSILSGIYLFLSALSAFSSEPVRVEFNPNVKRTVDGVSTFDRSKFITIHSTPTDPEWNGGQQGANNFTNDLLAAFILGNDVYFGRDTGYITWYLRNRIEEDPSRNGWARVSGSSLSMASQGSKARASYNNKPHLHPYESRNDEIMAAQFHPFWPDGTPTKLGWALSQANTMTEPFGSATAAYMGVFLNDFYGSATQVGRPLPKWVEVINEPDWELIDNGNTPPAKIWAYHNTVANGIRALNPYVKIGGYCAAFPDLEKDNFQEWRREWKLFIDTCGTNMDFYTLHLYDFPAFGSRQWYRKGSNLEATFDMIEQYSHLTLGAARPFVISEYGAQVHNLSQQPWSAYRDWLFVKSLSGMMMSFMDRPHLIEKTIPFIIPKAEWGRGNVPYNWRLMRQANEPASASGEWVYTEMVKFYELWSDVRGTRVDIKSFDPDLQADAYVSGNQAFVILNNLDPVTRAVELNVFEDQGNALLGVQEKNMYWDGSVIAIDQVTHSTTPVRVDVRAEGTAILHYWFADPVSLHHTSDESKIYADRYFQPIIAGAPQVFHLDAVPTGLYGEAILRLGMGRDHGRSKQPRVVFNGAEIPVPTDFMGHEGDDRPTFFGLLDIPVPYALLQQNNTTAITFPDTGGYISSVALRADVFSKDVRRVGAGGALIKSARIVGSNLVLHITNGVPSGLFDLLSTEEVGVPVENWFTNQAGLRFDDTGSATVTNPVASARSYFRVRETVPPEAPVPTITFDFENQPIGGDWDRHIEQTVGDYTLAGRMYGIKRAATDPDKWRGGFAFIGGADPQNLQAGSLTLRHASGAARRFTVESVDIETTGDATMTGRLNGTTVWRIVPSGTGDPAGPMPRYNAATTGDLNDLVDEVTFSQTGAGWGNRFDNLVVRPTLAPSAKHK